MIATLCWVVLLLYNNKTYLNNFCKFLVYDYYLALKKIYLSL